MKTILDEIKFIFPRRQKIQFIILFIMMFIGAIFELLGVSIILPFVQLVMDPDAIKNSSIMSWFYDFFNLQSTTDFILLLTIGLIAIYIVKNLYLLFMYKIQYRLVYNNQARISAKLMSSYMAKPYEYHLDQNTSNIVRSITQDVNYLFVLITSALSLFSEIVIAGMLCLFLMLTDFTISITVIILLGFCMVFILLRFRRILNKLGKENQKYYGKMIQWVNQSMGGLKEIKVLRREQFFVNSFIKNAQDYSINVQKNGVFAQIPRLLVETICVGGVLLVIAIRTIDGADIASIIPQLSVFAMAAFRLLPSTTRMGIYFNQIMFYKSSIDLICHELKECDKQEELRMENPQPGTIIPNEKKTIVLDNISYRYPNQEKLIVENISFQISFGKSIGLIGLSGSGKTTLADLILGVLKPEKGRIYYDGKDIRENSEFWSEKVGYIPQNIYLIDDSIRNNVAFGIPEDKIDDSKIWDALKQAQIDEFVENLSESLDTIIGEQGIRISGGQRQRLGIARALYHNPEVLVLDEATSALDTDTETAVMEAIDSLSGKKTMIIIAHRLTTTKKCDQIYKMEAGSLQKVIKEEII